MLCSSGTSPSDRSAASGSSRSTCAARTRAVGFDLVHGPVRKAEIVLTVDTPGARRTRRRRCRRQPFEIGAYEVRDAWDEQRVSWNTRPTAEEEPSSTVRTRPDEAEVRFDVTKSAARLADPDAAARGWLIQVVHPLPWDGT